ncbi:hypothetical protein KEM56_004007, partial [Ascosphaera pollenicola]
VAVSGLSIRFCYDHSDHMKENDILPGHDLCIQWNDHGYVVKEVNRDGMHHDHILDFGHRSANLPYEHSSKSLLGRSSQKKQEISMSSGMQLLSSTVVLSPP